MKSPFSEVNQIFLVAPTSTDERIKLATDDSSGFIYLISVTGITGKREKMAEDLQDLVSRIRKYSKIPVAVGFGISKPVHAAQVAEIADGVIVGSAIVDLIAKKKIKAVSRFVSSLRKAIDTSTSLSVDPEHCRGIDVRYNYVSLKAVLVWHVFQIFQSGRSLCTQLPEYPGDSAF